MDEDNMRNVAPRPAPTENILEYRRYEEGDDTNIASPKSIQVFLVSERTISNQEPPTSCQASQSHDPKATPGVNCMVCFCKEQPFAKPIIKCSSCSVWVHQTCAGHELNNISKKFKCMLCSPKRAETNPKEAWQEEQEAS